MYPGPVVPPTSVDGLEAAEELLVDVEDHDLAEQARVFAAVHQQLTSALAAADEQG